MLRSENSESLFGPTNLCQTQKNKQTLTLKRQPANARCWNLYYKMNFWNY